MSALKDCFAAEYITEQNPNQKLYFFGDPETWGDSEEKSFHAFLEGFDSQKPLEVHVNSYGGNLMAAFGVYNALSSFSGDIAVYIDAMAGSAASILCCLPNAKCLMWGSSFLFVHYPSMCSLGMQNASEMRKMAGTLDKMGQKLVEIYSAKTGLPAEQLDAMLREETLLTAEEAKQLGFCDQILEDSNNSQGKVVALLPARIMAKAQSKNILASVLPKCTKEDLQKASPSLYQSILEEGIRIERERLKAFDDLEIESPDLYASKYEKPEGIEAFAVRNLKKLTEQIKKQRADYLEGAQADAEEDVNTVQITEPADAYSISADPKVVSAFANGLNFF